MIHGKGRADYDLNERTVFIAIYLFIIVILYLGTVYVKAEYDRVFRESEKQKRQLE